MAEDLNQLKTWLSAAQTALHQVTIGGKAAEVLVDGHKVVYTQTSVNSLRQYIADLRARIIAAGGTEADGGVSRRVGQVFAGRGGGCMPNGFS